MTPTDVRLTPREWQTGVGLARGLLHKELAQERGTTTAAVSMAARSLRHKLGAGNAFEAGVLWERARLEKRA